MGFVSIWIVLALFFGVGIAGIVLCSILDPDNKILSGLLIALVVVLTIGSPILYIAIIESHTHQVDEQRHSDVVMEQELCAVHFDQTIEGYGYGSLLHHSFVLSNSDMYRYYYKINNRICQDSVPVNMSFIEYIDKNETPRIVEYHDYTTKQYLFDITEEVRETEPLDEWNYYVFYVPEDSVVETFDFS